MYIDNMDNNNTDNADNVNNDVLETFFQPFENTELHVLLACVFCQTA